MEDIEMGTPVNQINYNKQINMNNLVRNVENNLQSLESRRDNEIKNISENNNGYKVGGYQYEHEQLLNQNQNPVINIENMMELNRLNGFESNQSRQNIVNNLKNLQSTPPAIIEEKPRSWFSLLNKDFLVLVLLFSLFSHRKFNTLVVRFIPIISDNTFYTIYIVLKGVILSMLFSLYKNF